MQCGIYTFSDQLLRRHFAGFVHWAEPQPEGYYHSCKHHILDYGHALSLQEQEMQKLLGFPASENSDVSQAVRIYAKEQSRLSMERSIALLRKRGIDIDDPQWKVQLDSQD